MALTTLSPSHNRGLEELRNSFQLEGREGILATSFFRFSFPVPVLVCSEPLENWVLVC